MAQDKFLITSAFRISVTRFGQGRQNLIIAPENAICDKNNRLLAFRVLYDDGSYEDFILSPKETAAYNALKFVEKAAAIFAIGWAFAATKNEARNTYGAIQTNKILQKYNTQVDGLLDGIHDFIGVREWAYFNADYPSRGPVLEGPVYAK